jgi:hypothetical protein
VGVCGKKWGHVDAPSINSSQRKIYLSSGHTPPPPKTFIKFHKVLNIIILIKNYNFLFKKRHSFLVGFAPDNL